MSVLSIVCSSHAALAAQDAPDNSQITSNPKNDESFQRILEIWQADSDVRVDEPELGESGAEPVADSEGHTPEMTYTLGSGKWNPQILVPHGDGTRAYTVQADFGINIWAVTAFFWPEVATTALALLALAIMWAIQRRARTPGRLYCRTCNYDVTVHTSAICPECGTSLTVRRPGKGRRLRAAFIVFLCTASALPLAYLSWLWLLAFPRQGIVDGWLEWWSTGLYAYANDKGIEWLTSQGQPVESLIEIDIETGETIRTILVGRDVGRQMVLSEDESIALLTSVEVRSAARSGQFRRMAIRRIQLNTGDALGMATTQVNDWWSEIIGYDSQNNVFFVVSTADEQVQALDAETGEVVFSFGIECNKRTVGGATSYSKPLAVYSRSRNILVVGEYAGRYTVRTGPNMTWMGDSRRVTMRRAIDGALLSTLDEQTPLYGGVLSADGGIFYGVVPHEGVVAWNLDRPDAEPWVVAKPPQGISLWDVSVDPRGRFLVCRDFRSSTLAVFDLRTAEWIDTLVPSAGTRPSIVGFSSDGRFFVTRESNQVTFAPQFAVYDLSDLRRSGLDDADASIQVDPSTVDRRDAHGRTALHHAVAAGDVPRVRVLLANGADARIASHEGMTPLDLAARSGRLEIMRALIEAGADAEKRSSNGKTPFHIAREALRDNPDAVDAVEALEHLAISKKWTYAPTIALIDMLTDGRENENLIVSEILRRVDQSDLQPDEWRMLFEACARGDETAIPINEKWKDTYGKIIERADQPLWYSRRLFADESIDVAEPLYAIPLGVTIRTRDVWPAGMPVFVQVEMKSWWPFPTSHRVVVTPRLDGAESTRMIGPVGGFFLPLTEPQTTEVVVDIGVEQYRHWETGAQWEMVDTFERTIPVRIEGSIDDALDPVKSDELTETLRTGLHYEIGDRWVNFDPAVTQQSRYEGIAFGVTMEFLLDGEVVATEHRWWAGGAGSLPDDRDWGWSGHSPTLAKPGEKWTIRVRSNPELALRAVVADKYWIGEFEMPLTISDR